jgi:hypothetical protein
MFCLPSMEGEAEAGIALLGKVALSVNLLWSSSSFPAAGRERWRQPRPACLALRLGGHMDDSHWRGAHARPWLGSQRELGTMVGKLSKPLCPIKIPGSTAHPVPALPPTSFEAPCGGTPICPPLTTAWPRWWGLPGHKVL